MTRFDLYIFEPTIKQKEEGSITSDSFVTEEKLLNKDLTIKIFYSPHNDGDIRGNHPGVVQLVGYFDDFDGKFKNHRTGFSRVGPDKINGVVLLQRDITTNSITNNEDFEGLIDSICNNIDYFNFIIDKLNSKI